MLLVQKKISMPDTITAIILNFNKANEIGTTLKSVLEQTIPFDEIIIIDDSSTDDSVQKIQNYTKNFSNVRLIQNKTRKGVVYGCNLGVTEATSEFVYLISAEDRYSAVIVETAKKMIELFPDAGMYCGNLSQTKNGTTKKQLTLPFKMVPGYISKEQFHSALKRKIFTFFGGSNVIRKEAILEVKGFRENLKWHSDWFLYLLVGMRFKIALLPIELRSEAISKDQYSSGMNDWKQQQSVVSSLIHTLKTEHQVEYALFRQYGLLPLYNMSTLLFLLKNNDLRDFITIKLSFLVPLEVLEDLYLWGFTILFDH
jgi:glycosyltransferase involved in cell wall biosynthesis